MEVNETTAEFYVKISYELDVEFDQLDTKAESDGKGSGRLTYDIKNAVTTYYETDTEMKMSIPLEGITVTTWVKANTIQETESVQN